MDAKYIEGMINNPDLQPNATINCWITGILLFTFHLIHIPATHYTRADGLSHCPLSKDDPPQEDDFEDWLDRVYSFFVSLLNNHISLFGDTANISRHPIPALHSLHTIFILFSANSDSAQEDPELPCSPKAITKDAQINLIHNFLQSHTHPSNLSDSDYTSFVNATTCFFFLNGSLYYHESHGQYQLVVSVECCYELIKEAHDSLRHKDVFSVWMRLLLHFWWPMLVDNIKWYIKTCYECQICQTQKLHILPTVLVVGRLFHKVHIDTMVMP